MRRRDVLTGLLAIATTSGVQAADQNRVRRLAVCTQFAVNFSSTLIWPRLFSGLHQIGFVEGKNLIIDRYMTEGRDERYEEIARTIVQAKPDVIALDFDHSFILQVAKETRTIPIVATFGDPVAAGIVKNMARPESNVTGVSLDAGIEMQGKHLEILRQAVPSASRVAYLSNRADWEGAWGQTAREAGERLGVAIIGIAMEHSAGEPDFRQAFENMRQQSVQALMANGHPPNFRYRELIIELALRERLPSITWWPDLVEKGNAFLSYAPNYSYYFDLWADEVGQALRGVAPADIPIQQATKLMLMVNLKTAKSMGLDVPTDLVLRADKVIE